jgi:hypothetical protein
LPFFNAKTFSYIVENCCYQKLALALLICISC